MPANTALAPLQTLVDSKRGRLLPLPSKLARLYGSFRMPVPRSRPQVFSNFVSTLDGVVSLQVKGHAGGGDISGFSAQDRMVMGLLRAVADVVIVGSGTFGADSRQVWTPEAICPELANDYRRLRDALLERRMALNVIVSASGNIDLRLPIFSAGRVPVLILTTPAGAKRLARQKPPASVGIRAMRSVGGRLAPRAILQEVTSRNSRQTGPRRRRPAFTRFVLLGAADRRAVFDARAANSRPRGGRPPAQPRDGQAIRAPPPALGHSDRCAPRRQPDVSALFFLGSPQ